MVSKDFRTRLRRDDQIVVISGREKGKTGRILTIDRDRNRVVVEGINLVKKAVKPSNQDRKGGITEVEASLHISNVMLNSRGGRSRTGSIVVDGKKQRLAKKTGEQL
jgi:large subunit ribosomal protein L24